ncbi:hypothetical protein [Microviridae sp.]|nr:hypothetical protein [Microviridae sp.]
MPRKIVEQGATRRTSYPDSRPVREIDRLLQQPFTPRNHSLPLKPEIVRIADKLRPQDKFIPRPPAKEFGRKLASGLGKAALGRVVRAPLLDLGQMVIDNADVFFPGPKKLNMPGWNLTGGDFWENECDAGLPPDGIYATDPIKPFAIPTVPWGCYPGQLIAGPDDPDPRDRLRSPVVVPPDVGRITFYKVASEGNGYVYGIAGKTYERNSPTWSAPEFTVQVTQQLLPVEPIDRDPNILRKSLTPPLALPSFHDSPEGRGEPSPGAKGGTGFAITVSTKGDFKKERYDPPKNPTPGRKRRKDSKYEGTKKILALLDTVSEASEIVDAIYETLPKDVKDRWGKGRADRPLLDSAGQYGIDGAEWKLQALWHNWDKIDANAAVENILKNLVEDKIAGAVHKRLPANSGTVGGPVGSTSSDLVDWLFELI